MIQTFKQKEQERKQSVGGKTQRLNDSEDKEQFG